MRLRPDRQVDQERGAFDKGTSLPQQLGGGTRGAPCGDEIVDQHHTPASLDGTRVDLEPVGAVFEVVVHAQRGHRRLAGLADGHEAHAQLHRHRCAEDEAPRFQAGDRFRPGQMTIPGAVAAK